MSTEVAVVVFYIKNILGLEASGFIFGLDAYRAYKKCLFEVQVAMAKHIAKYFSILVSQTVRPLHFL